MVSGFIFLSGLNMKSLFYFFLLSPIILHAQSGIEGYITDTENGKPLTGANVIVRDTQLGTATDEDGYFRILDLSPGEHVLEVRMIGYLPHVRMISVPGDSIIRVDFGLIPEPIQLEEIVVEARAIDLLEKPFSREFINRQDFEGLAPVTTAELLRDVPGVVASRTGGWGTKPYIEGMTDSRILVTIDGAKVNQACPMGMDACTATIEPDMIDRIEVQRGPGSAQFGSGAMGGVIRVTTRGSDYTTGSDFRTSVGLVSRYRSASNSRITNLTFSGGNRKFDFVLGAGGGLHDDYRTREGVINNSGFDSGYLNLKARYRPTENQQLMILSNIYRARDIGWPSANTVIPTEKRDTYVLNYTVTGISESLRELSLNVSAQPMHHDMKNFLPDGTVWIGVSNTSTYDAGVESNWTLGRNHRINAGIQFSYWGMSAERDAETGLVNILPNSSLIETGMYVEDEFRLSDRVDVTAGLRYNYLYSDADRDPSLTVEIDELQSSEHLLTGSLGLLYRIRDSRVITLSVARGFKGATPVERYVSAPMLDGYYHVGEPRLNSETNLSTRLGFRGMENRVRWNFEVYYNRLSNFISREVDPDMEIPFGLRGVKRFLNLGEGIVLGGSGSLGVSITQSLILNTGFTYNRGEDRRTGNPLPFMSPLQFQTSLSYEMNNFRIEGEMRAAAAQNRYAERAGEIGAPAYAVFNIRGGWEITNGLEIRAGLENIFDTYYRDHLNLAQLPEPGRNAYLTLSVNLPLGGQSRKIDHKNVRTVTINVDGMACEFCARTVRERLNRVEGVVSADVRFAEDLVNVSFDPARVSVRDLVRIINRLGYRARMSRN